MHHVTGATQVVGIIGHPVRHSLSPAMQNAAFQAAGLDYVYVPFMVHPDQLEKAVSGLIAVGVLGFNVTIPHKTAIIPHLHVLHESAEAAGAVNTVQILDGVMTGYNTDGVGLIDALANDLGFVPSADEIVVIGAGGASRGAIAALCRAGAKRIIICNRTFDRASELAAEMNQRYPESSIGVIRQDEMSGYSLDSCCLLLNTTSLGMKGENHEYLHLVSMSKDAKIFDMVYAPLETPLLKSASQRGINAVNGLGMLAAQGEYAFTIWTGQSPPKGLMKRVLQKICGT